MTDTDTPPSINNRSATAHTTTTHIRSARPAGVRLRARAWWKPAALLLGGFTAGAASVGGVALFTDFGNGAPAFSTKPFWEYTTTDTGLPAAQGADEADTYRDALEAYRDAHGTYPTAPEELAAAGVMQWNEQLRYRLEVNPERTAFIAGVVGETGGYAAFISDSTRVGAGDSFQDALTDAGWDTQWAIEHGFGAIAEVTRHYGVIAVTPTEVIEVRAGDTTPDYTLTVRPVPKTGVGGTWQDAVTAAGGDPGVFHVETDTWPVTVDGEGARATITRDGESFTALVELAPTVTDTNPNLTALLAGHDLAHLEPVANGRYTCSTSTGLNELDYVTVCVNTLGAEQVAYASTGQAASSTLSIVDAASIAGATTVWLDEHGIPQPDYSDLF